MLSYIRLFCGQNVTDIVALFNVFFKIYGTAGMIYLFLQTIPTEVIIMNQRDLPLGLGMALAQNESAMKRFEGMSETEKQSIIQMAKGVSSKREMRAIVDGIGTVK